MNLNLKHLMVRAGGFRQNTVLRREDKKKIVIKRKKKDTGYLKRVSLAKQKNRGKDGINDRSSACKCKRCRFELEKNMKRNKNESKQRKERKKERKEQKRRKHNNNDRYDKLSCLNTPRIRKR